LKVWEKARVIRKTHGNGKNWFLPGKMGKREKLPFFKIHVKTYVKSMANK
jgi:hypothetical protein